MYNNKKTSSRFHLCSTHGASVEFDKFACSEETAQIIERHSKLINDYHFGIALMRQTLGYTTNLEDTLCIKDQIQMITTLCIRLMDYRRYTKGTEKAAKEEKAIVESNLVSDGENSGEDREVGTSVVDVGGGGKFKCTLCWPVDNGGLEIQVPRLLVNGPFPNSLSRQICSRLEDPLLLSIARLLAADDMTPRLTTLLKKLTMLSVDPETGILNVPEYSARKIIIWNKMYLESLMYRLHQTQHHATIFLKRLNNISMQMGIYSDSTRKYTEMLQQQYYLNSTEKRCNRSRSFSITDSSKRNRRIYSFKQAVHATIKRKPQPQQKLVENPDDQKT